MLRFSRRLASGALAVLDRDGRVTEILPAGPEADEVEAMADEAETQAMSCSICDGLGHGYPGGGPCPLENTGRCDCNGRMAFDGSGCLCGGS